MFFVFNKRKINSYLISLGTVAILSFISFMSISKNPENTIQTQASVQNEIFEPIFKSETTTKQIALSINCSENAENIESILEILAKMNSKATFYITGKIAKENSEKVKKIIASGNEVGSLSNNYMHLNLKSVLEVRKEIQESVEILNKITNQKVKTFRAPYGEYNKTIIKEARNQNLEIVGWNIDSLDYNGLDEEEMIERINENLKPGSIVLMHNSAKNTATSLEGIISNLQKSGYKITTVQELIS